jgi:hypothetical protein
VRLILTKQEKTDLLDKLERAIYSGHMKVKNGDKEIQYNSVDQMMKVRDALKVELGLASKVTRRIFATHSKGLAE